jgi:Holliday junction resolvase
LSEIKNDLIFECKSAEQIGGVQLRKGDILKFEQPDFEEVLKIKNLILSKLNQKSTAIIFFHLDKTCLKNYETKTLFE